MQSVRKSRNRVTHASPSLLGSDEQTMHLTGPFGTFEVETEVVVSVAASDG